MTRVRILALTTAAVLLEVLPLVAAHGHQHQDASMDMKSEVPPPQVQDSETAQTYWRLSEHAAAMYWHIGLEVLAWIFILPVGVLTAPFTAPISANMIRCNA